MDSTGREWRYLREREVLERTNVARSTWWRWVAEGKAVKPYRLGDRCTRWRSDEGMVIDMLQTSGGDFSTLRPIDFDDPDSVTPAGQVEVGFLDCTKAWINLDLDERTTGQALEQSIELVKLIGVPEHVCEAASIPLPSEGASVARD